jgi:hypothetical protein
MIKREAIVGAMRIAARAILCALAAGLLCCLLTQTAVSQTRPKSGQKMERAAKIQPEADSDDARAVALSRAEKQQKAWDASSAVTMKSICANC